MGDSSLAALYGEVEMLFVMAATVMAAGIWPGVGSRIGAEEAVRATAGLVLSPHLSGSGCRYEGSGGHGGGGSSEAFSCGCLRVVFSGFRGGSQSAVGRSAIFFFRTYPALAGC